MKLIYIISNISNLDFLIEKISEIGEMEYQIIEKMMSNSLLGNPRMDNSVWPGYSSGVLIQTQDNSQVNELLNLVRTHNQNRINDDEIIKLFSWNIDECIIE